MKTLESRRIFYDLLFLFKIVNSIFDSPELVGLIEFRVPNRDTRNSDTFHCRSIATNYIRHTLVPRLHSSANLYLQNIDIFNINMNEFKTLARLAVDNMLD
jgi:hypothetical protein